MATPVLLPKQGITVESCLIVEWKKKKDEGIKKGEVVCTVETDKATFEVEAPADGVLLETFFGEGDLVPVLTNIAVIGKPGEDTGEFRPDGTQAPGLAPASEEQRAGAVQKDKVLAEGDGGERPRMRVSARARRLAKQRGVPLSSVPGTGPGGRIIERDLIEASGQQQPLTPAAMEKMIATGKEPPVMGSGIGGRVLAADIGGLEGMPLIPVRPGQEDRIREIPMTGFRKIIADRMIASLQTTAQLTMNSSADAGALLSYREKLKSSPESYELRDVTLNAMVLYATVRTLGRHRNLNGIFTGDKILEYENVHLAFAVDTPKGLIVPVIKNAQDLGLKRVSDEAKRLTEACLEGKVNPDELTGGTFTVTNLGMMGIESFTPVLNAPQVAILGVSGIGLKPVMRSGEVSFVPHIGLSLTINHQVVDGAPAARFLQELSQAIAHFDLNLAR